MTVILGLVMVFGLVFGGFDMIGEIKQGLLDGLIADGHATVAGAVGSGVAEWASRPLA